MESRASAPFDLRCHATPDHVIGERMLLKIYLRRYFLFKAPRVSLFLSGHRHPPPPQTLPFSVPPFPPHTLCLSLFFFSSSLRYWTRPFAGRLKSNENLWVHYRLHIYPRVGSFTSPGRTNTYTNSTHQTSDCGIRSPTQCSRPAPHSLPNSSWGLGQKQHLDQDT